MRYSNKIANHSLFIAIFAFFLLLSMETAIAQTDAKAAVDRYMNSLFAGDIENIKKCLGKDLRDRRKNTFKDPDYKKFLTERYDGATYRIIEDNQKRNGRNLVDVEITFNTSQKLRIRLLLDAHQKIIDEIVP